MKTAVFMYPWDIVDEGIDFVLDKINETGIDGIYVAFKYHTGQMLLTHNPNKKIYYAEPGVIYFRPDKNIYKKSLIKPIISSIVENYDVLDIMSSKTKERGIGLYAWILGFHSTAIGKMYPSTTIVNAYGDHLITCQCPSNYDAVEHLVNIVKDITSNYEVDKLLLESVENLGVNHGFHHEFIGVPLTPYIHFLLGLCFCPSCAKRAEKNNIDIISLKSYVKKTVNDFLHEEIYPEKEDWNWIKKEVNGQMGEYLKMRQNILTGVYKLLDSEIRKNSHCEIIALDFGPFSYSYQLGNDNSSWENGVNLSEISQFTDSIMPTFYQDDLNEVEKRFKEYINILKNKSKLTVAVNMNKMAVGKAYKDISKFLPEVISFFKCKSIINEISFYNYSYVRYKTLDLIKKSILV